MKQRTRRYRRARQNRPTPPIPHDPFDFAIVVSLDTGRLVGFEKDGKFEPYVRAEK